MNKKIFLQVKKSWIILFFLTAVSTAGFYFFFKNYPVCADDSVTMTVKISVCGNEITESGEDCDNEDLAGATCISHGFLSGSLSCDLACEYDTSGCSLDPSCGDGRCNGNETCGNCSNDCGNCPPPPGGGGGGNGSFIAPSVTRAIFKGKAYPGSKVTLLKDGQLVVQLPAGPDANFEISIAGLSGGTYNFGVWSEDPKGNRSITHAFSETITSGVSTVISGIFLPPTINIDKTEVKHGEVLNILGYSAPSSEITLLINSEEEIIKKFAADSDGAWLFKFDTLEAEKGDHKTRARAAKDNNITDFSHAISFKISDKTVYQPISKTLKGNLNSDNRVNLVDFSIMAYWFKRPNPPASVDLNNDSKIDLVDFSIMAFYWTG